MKRIDNYWDTVNPVSIALLPLSWIFCLLAWLRRLAYRTGLFGITRLQVPVIVVGNITVGGAGKTPLVIWLANHLKERGYRPGIISRGYGGQSARGYGGQSDGWPQQVVSDSDPSLVGDEPVLIARRTGCPMWVGPDRVAAAMALAESSDIDIILSDDGMQHYALGRNVEIAVIDGIRQLGNGFCLPAGPLREQPSRLKQVDQVIFNGGNGNNQPAMLLRPTVVVQVSDPAIRVELDSFSDAPVHAVAGIGHPERFFDFLRSLGLKVMAHSFDDHHRFAQDDVTFEDDRPVLMTEKDAVKCAEFAEDRHWYVEVEADPDEAFVKRLDELMRGMNNG